VKKEGKQRMECGDGGGECGGQPSVLLRRVDEAKEIAAVLALAAALARHKHELCDIDGPAGSQATINKSQMYKKPITLIKRGKPRI
jgi:xanthine/CO dehydrogenase XdhC/CoxF family maturation factor